MDSVVNADAQDNGGHKYGKGIQLAIEQGRKCKSRKTGIKHRGCHQDWTLHTSEEEDGEDDNQNKANRKREDGIVCDFVDFFKSFVSAFYRKAGRNRISLVAEVGEQGVCTGENVSYKFVVGRGLDKLGVYNAVEQDFSGAVGRRTTDKAVSQGNGYGLFLVPFFAINRGILVFLLEEGIECACGFIGETKFLRNVGAEPNAFFFLSRCGVCRRCF